MQFLVVLGNQANGDAIAKANQWWFYMFLQLKLYEFMIHDIHGCDVACFPKHMT